MKVVYINFMCPHCTGLYEIFMKKTPQLMTFNCPSCKQFLTIYNGTVLVFNETLMQKIKNIKTESDATAILSYIDEKIKMSNNSVLEKDDVLNFSIHLHQCNNFDEVMDLICKS